MDHLTYSTCFRRPQDIIDTEKDHRQQLANWTATGRPIPQQQLAIWAGCPQSQQPNWIPHVPPEPQPVQDDVSPGPIMPTEPTEQTVQWQSSYEDFELEGAIDGFDTLQHVRDDMLSRAGDAYRGALAFKPSYGQVLPNFTKNKQKLQARYKRILSEWTTSGDLSWMTWITSKEKKEYTRLILNLKTPEDAYHVEIWKTQKFQEAAKRRANCEHTGWKLV